MRKSKGASASITPSSKQQLITAINELFETANVAKFLSGTLAREEGSVTLSVQELYGLSNILESLTERIEKIACELSNIEGACHE